MSAGDRVEIGVLTFCGLLVGVLSVFLLQMRVGAVPVPIGVLFAAFGNWLLLRLASAVTDSPWRYAPLSVWGLVVFVGVIPGLGGNMMLYGSGQGPDWRFLLLLLGGLGVPALAAQMRRLDDL